MYRLFTYYRHTKQQHLSFCCVLVLSEEFQAHCCQHFNKFCTQVIFTVVTMALIASDFLTALALAIAGVYFCLKFLNRKNLPPGPNIFTILANIREFGSYPYVVFEKWAKIYGPIVRVKVAHMDQVIISDPKIVKELFSHHAANGRLPDNPFLCEMCKGNYGALNSNGPTWEEQHRFTLRTLRNFGFAKSTMESLVLDEAQVMIKWFHKSAGKPITGIKIFTAPVVNSLWHIVTGERCEWEEGNGGLVDDAEKMFRDVMDLTTSGVFFLPIIRHIVPEICGWNKFLKSMSRMHTIVEEVIEKHKETFQEDHMRDFIDCFLLEMKKTTNPSSSFYGEEGYKNLSATVLELLVAGSETTANTCAWVFLHLSQYQEIQERIYKEISNVVESRIPSTADRPQLPYTEAFVNEILRMHPVAPLALPHCMVEDKVVEGYLFQKGMGVFANIYAIHRDPAIWGDPENFRPDRFLSDDGSKVEKHGAMIAFSDGKRKCLGETLARDTLFLFLVSFVQHFKILPANDDKPDFEPAPGFAHIPKEFEIIMSPRHQM